MVTGVKHSTNIQEDHVNTLTVVKGLQDISGNPINAASEL